MIWNTLKRALGLDPNDRALRKYEGVVEQINEYFTALKESDNILLQNDNFVVLTDALSAGETMLAWHRIALHDKVRLDKSIKNLFQLAITEEYRYLVPATKVS